MTERRRRKPNFRAAWRAPWFWEFAREHWPEDVALLEGPAEPWPSRNYSNRVSAMKRMRGRYEGALAMKEGTA